jgi:FkbM family methyltransferase
MKRYRDRSVVKHFVRTSARNLLRRISPKIMHARALSHTRWSELEEEVLPHVVDPGREAVDAGANIGQYSVALARLARRVYAFEPVEEVSTFLARAAPANVTVYTEALSDSEGTRTLRVPTTAGVPSPTLAAIGDAPTNYPDDACEVRSVHASTLDKLADRDIGFVKIDVEGHELEVLAGGSTLISRQRPVVLVEIEDRHKAGSIAAVSKFFDAFGYRGFFLYEGRTRPLEDFTLDMQNPAELERSIDRKDMHYVNNFFFAPSPSIAQDMRRKIDEQLQERLHQGGP